MMTKKSAVSCTTETPTTRTRDIARFALGIALGLIGAGLFSSHPGTAQTDDENVLPGAFCQPGEDEDFVGAYSHAYIAYEAVDTFCPFFTTYQYRSSEMDDTDSAAGIRVYDSSASVNVIGVVCRNSGQSSTTQVCGTSDATLGDNVWDTLTPDYTDTGSIGDVWYAIVCLPEEDSLVHSYWINDN